MIKHQLIIAYREEEAYWGQKSQNRWLDEGDKNTKFFHASVKATRKRKRIEKLQDVNGNFQFGKASKGEIATRYLCDLFKSTNPSNFQDIFHDFTPRVSESMNNSLVKEISDEEIKDVVFAIKPASAPGLMACQDFSFRNIGV